MVSVFEFENYRGFLKAYIKSQGPKSYGWKGRMAEALSISSSLVSQIFSEQKTLTSEQASDLCDFIGLSEIESEYLHILVDLDRSSHFRFQQKLKRKLLKLKQTSHKIGKRVPRTKELSDEEKAIYYSSWLYTGMRNLSALENINSLEDISQQLKINPQSLREHMSFLLKRGLIINDQGQLTYGTASTHVDKESPFVNQHHHNWRVQALQRMEEKNNKHIFFTSPMSLSKEAYDEICEMIPNFIQKVMDTSSPSKSEKTACLNIDWFEY